MADGVNIYIRVVYVVGKVARNDKYVHVNGGLFYLGFGTKC